MTFKISSEKIEEFIERQHAIDGMVSMHDFELWLEEQPRVGGKDTNVPSKWIPCSERLPEESGDYLVTIYLPQHDRRFMSFKNFDGVRFITELVIAWMPLPPAFVEGDKQ